MEKETQTTLIAVSIALDHYQKGLVKEIHPEMKLKNGCIQVAKDLIVYLDRYNNENPWECFMKEWNVYTKKEALSKWMLSQIGIKQ